MDCTKSMEELFGVVDLLRPFVDMFVLFFTVVKKWNAHALARARAEGGEDSSSTVDIF